MAITTSFQEPYRCYSLPVVAILPFIKAQDKVEQQSDQCSSMFVMDPRPLYAVVITLYYRVIIIHLTLSCYRVNKESLILIGPFVVNSIQWNHWTCVYIGKTTCGLHLHFPARNSIEIKNNEAFLFICVFHMPHGGLWSWNARSYLWFCNKAL